MCRGLSTCNQYVCSRGLPAELLQINTISTDEHDNNKNNIQHTSQHYNLQQQTTNTTSMKTNKRSSSWLKRSTAFRTVSYVERKVDTFTSTCRLLLNNSSDTKTTTIAQFHRDEIQLGSLIGEGAFSSVYQVESIQLRDDDDDDDSDEMFFDSDYQVKKRRRQELQQQTLSSSSQQHHGRKYVMKHLRQELVNPVCTSSSNKAKATNNQQYHRKKFQDAASDLVIEATFLSYLNHPHIIKLRGVAMNGIQSYANGLHDGYFLLFDQLDSTLSIQLHQWRKEGQHEKTTKSNPTSSSKQQQQNIVKLNYAYQIATALEYLHSHEIIYRDLKPDNIGIQYNHNTNHDNEDTIGTIQLFDFGLCRELPPNDDEEEEDEDDEEDDDRTTNSCSSSTSSYTNLASSSNTSSSTTTTSSSSSKTKVFRMSGVGTRRYMAPEVILGQPYNLKADVYSYSIVLYEMITLQTPFELYNPQVHELLVCEGGERPQLDDNFDAVKHHDDSTTTTITTTHNFAMKDIHTLIRSTWSQSFNDRPTMKYVCIQLQDMLTKYHHNDHNESSKIPSTSSSSTTTFLSTFFKNTVHRAATARRNKANFVQQLQPTTGITKRQQQLQHEDRTNSTHSCSSSSWWTMMSGTGSSKLSSMSSFDLE